MWEKKTSQILFGGIFEMNFLRNIYSEKFIRSIAPYKESVAVYDVHLADYTQV